ncbi:type II toxin-antitoxin system antitoxin SocA domain-containing protein [Streptococcus pneumoniae]
MKVYTIEQVSDWFLFQSSMTPKKLQKLSYYFEAWGNALFNISLIYDTKFEAWVHGPVSPELYQKYRDYGWNEIEKLDKNTDSEFEEKSLFLLQSVWETYGDKSANELEALTHGEMPWIKARGSLADNDSCNTVISEKDMREFYLSIYSGD